MACCYKWLTLQCCVHGRLFAHIQARQRPRNCLKIRLDIAIHLKNPLELKFRINTDAVFVAMRLTLCVRFLRIIVICVIRLIGINYFFLFHLIAYCVRVADWL